MFGLAIAGWFGWQAFLLSPRLQIEDIEVVGWERTSPSEVLAHADVHRGQPILEVDLDEAAVRVRRHPWVKSARVLRRLPDTLRIEVEEYLPAITVALQELYLADAEGNLFKRVSADDSLSLPVGFCWFA